MSRVFNMQTYLLSLLNEAFLFSLDSPRLVLAYIFSHRAMLVVPTQCTLTIPS